MKRYLKLYIAGTALCLVAVCNVAYAEWRELDRLPDAY